MILLDLVSFSSISSLFVFMNTLKNFLYPHLLATTKAFVVQTGDASLHEVIPCHYDNDSEEKKWSG